MKRSDLKRTGGLARVTPLLARAALTARSGLTRNTPLPMATGPLPRHGGTGGDTPQKARRREQLATWAEVKQQAHQRDGWRCVGCGTDRDLDCQHRANKGMGGSKQLDTIANALTLCRRCHEFADTHKNGEGAARGWTVPAGTDPATWPIRCSDGHLYLHDDAGTRSRVG